MNHRDRNAHAELVAMRDARQNAPVTTRPKPAQLDDMPSTRDLLIVGAMLAAFVLAPLAMITP